MELYIDVNMVSKVMLTKELQHDTRLYDQKDNRKWYHIMLLIFQNKISIVGRLIVIYIDNQLLSIQILLQSNLIPN